VIALTSFTLLPDSHSSVDVGSHVRCLTAEPLMQPWFLVSKDVFEIL
jgi:hypothetical protein